MAKRKTPREKTKVTETIDLSEAQSSQVKGGALPLLHSALTKNESTTQSPKDSATGLTVGKR